MAITIVGGGAGFVGFNLIQSLALDENQILILDNLCRGKIEYVEKLKSLYPNKVHFYKVDLSDQHACLSAFKFAQELGQIDEVWHLAANSDIASGVMDAHVDLRDTFMTTFSILEAMKFFHVKCLNFASSSAIYGDLGDITLHESVGPLLPISNYGAMKLASEALISAAAESYLDKINIFRFPNVVGLPATHGVILDFINKLKHDESRLDVLGDGTQQKAYLHVSDLVDAMLLISKRSDLKKIEVINIGPVDDGITVDCIARQVVARINPAAKIFFGTGNKGWVGDVPKFKYSIARLQSYGWAPKMSSETAIQFAINQMAELVCKK